MKKLKQLLKSLFRDEVDPRLFLAKFIAHGSVGAEIGVWKGDFSALVLGTGRLAKYYLIDPYRFMPEYPQRLYGGKVARSQDDMDEIFLATKAKLDQFNVDKTFIRKLSSEAHDRIDDRSLDFLYIDGNHYYSGVTSDLENYLGKMKVGSYLILDDWHWKDDEGRTSVKAAMCDFLVEHPNALHLVEIRNNQAVFLVLYSR